MEIEIRGIIVHSDGSDKIVSAVVKNGFPDMYEKHELFRNKVVNRGRVLTALGKIFDIDPGKIVWPRHIKIKDL